MNKKLNLLFFLFASLLISSCESNSQEPKIVRTDKKASLIELSFNLSKIQDKLSKLDSLESVSAPITAKVIEGNKQISRSSVITPVQGTITNLGNHKTLWKYGVGENLVPFYFCGSSFNEMTISTQYKISVRYDLSDEFMIRGYIGDKTGWNDALLNNPQIKWQGTCGDETYVEFYTYVYDIISTIQGYAPHGGHAWVPFKENEAKIYVKIFE